MHVNSLHFSTDLILNALVTGEWIVDSSSSRSLQPPRTLFPPSHSSIHTQNTTTKSNSSNSSSLPINTTLTGGPGSREGESSDAESNGYILPVSSYRSPWLHLSVSFIKILVQFMLEASVCFTGISYKL